MPPRIRLEDTFCEDADAARQVLGAERRTVLADLELDACSFLLSYAVLLERAERLPTLLDRQAAFDHRFAGQFEQAAELADICARRAAELRAPSANGSPPTALPNSLPW